MTTIYGLYVDRPSQMERAAVPQAVPSCLKHHLQRLEPSRGLSPIVEVEGLGITTTTLDVLSHQYHEFQFLLPHNSSSLPSSNLEHLRLRSVSVRLGSSFTIFVATCNVPQTPLTDGSNGPE
uniref:Uncharacterized protein n=1 Tax=Lepeophtheirus salmonis TaxID=72036 RepID=A0A0K2UP26_LEPSM